MRRLLASLLLLLLLTACGQPEEPVRQQFFAMDTVMTVAAYGRRAETALAAAAAEINRLESLLSRTREGSQVRALNAAAPAAVPIGEDLAGVLALSVEWSAKTGGAFDVTVGPVAAAWGFGGAGVHRVPRAEELKHLLTLVDSAALTVTENSAALGRPGMEADLGGIAKGWAAGKAEQVLRDRGVESALLDLGGSITAVGSRPDSTPWRVAVRDPENGGGMVGVLSLSDCSAVTSGGYQRYFEQGGQRYHHIIDPRTGCPAESGLLSATVVCCDPALADLLSTAVFVLGEEEALSLRQAEGGFELVLVTEDGRLVVTEGLQGRFEPAEGCPYVLEYAR